MQESIDTQDKLDEFFRIIDERILTPIKSSQVQSSCTATLMLLFAGIDSLGTLMHPRRNAKVTARIEHFLKFMGGKYSTNSDKLVKLRHSLMHSAINIESYMSRTTTSSEHHLDKIAVTGFIYVSTNKMTSDFEEALVRFKSIIRSDLKIFSQVSSRLEWNEEDYPSEFVNTDEARPSPPPPVQFIQTNGKIVK